MKKRKMISDDWDDCMERTLILIKPDAMERGLAEQIIKRYEDAGLKVVAKKTVKVDRELAEKHYPDTDAQVVGMGKKTLEATKDAGNYDEIVAAFGTDNPREIGMELRERLIEFITAAPVLAVVLEGENAIKEVRKVTGYTDPVKAEKGTIRGDLGEDSINKANLEGRSTKNLVHASGDKEEAEREIKLWFAPEELE